MRALTNRFVCLLVSFCGHCGSLSRAYSSLIVTVVWGLAMCSITRSALAQLPVSYAEPVKLATQARLVSGERVSESLSVVYLPPALEFNFYLDVWQGISAVAKLQGHRVSQLAPQTDNPAEQMKMLASTLSQHIDAIILSTHDERAAAPLIKQAIARGVLVVVVNSDNLTFATPVHAVVGYAQRKATFQLGRYGIALAKGAPWQVGIIEGEAGYHSRERVGGFEQALVDTNMNIVAKANGQWSTQGGYLAALTMLQQQPDINMIFAANDFEVIGAAAALAELGRNDVILLGNDGVADVMPYIAEGRVAATVHTNPQLMGRVAMQVVVDLASKQLNGGFIETPTELVTKDNVGQFYSLPREGDIPLLPNEIVVVSEPLAGLATPEGNGLYWDLLRAVYEPLGIAVVHNSVPLKRAKLMIATQYADAMLGHHRGDANNMLFPQWHYAAHTITAIFPKGAIDWQGELSLQGKRAAWIRGADYQSYLTVELPFEEKNDHLGPLLMLAAKRVDLVLDDRQALEKTFRIHATKLQQAGIHRADYQIEHVMQLKLYPAFADTAKGRKLAQLFDEQIPKLISSGKMRALYDKWGVKPYPF